MMDCGECDALLDAWEEGAELDSGRLGEAMAHIEACARCSRSREALLPFLARDSREAEAPSATLPSAAASALAGAVMARIASAEGGAPGARRRRTPRLPVPRRRTLAELIPFRPRARPDLGRRLAIGAAAALLAFALGLGSYLGLRDPDMVTVHFVLKDPAARSVALSGDFTGWKGRGLELHRSGKDGAWEITLKLRKGGLYAYNFIVDGEDWIPDPSVPERVEDGFGGSSSLLRL